MENNLTVRNVARAFYLCEFAKACSGCPYNSEDNENPTFCIDRLHQDVLNILESYDGDEIPEVNIYDSEDEDTVSLDEVDDDFFYKMDDIADFLKGRKVG